MMMYSIRKDVEIIYENNVNHKFQDIKDFNDHNIMCSVPLEKNISLNINIS